AALSRCGADPADRARVRPAPAAGTDLPSRAARQAGRALVRQRRGNDRARPRQAGQEPGGGSAFRGHCQGQHSSQLHSGARRAARLFVRRRHQQHAPEPGPVGPRMTRSKTLRVTLMIAAALAASGCGTFKKGKKTNTPVLGQRIAVLTGENDVTVDPATATMPMTLPEAVANTEWSQSGGNASKSMGQLALGNALAGAFNVQAGRGSSLTARLAAAPIVAGGHVYVIDTLGTVRAFDGRTGALLWASQTPTEKGGQNSIYGGGLAYDQGRIYATNGLGYVVALDERNGGSIWRVRPTGPLRGAPTVANGAIYVMSQDNQIFSLKEDDGSTNWSAAASLEIAGVFGSASPAVGQGTVVAGFSSGELNAYRYENGRQVWQDALQRTSIRTSVSSLSDIDADPVIDNGQVFAVGQGGRMVALELTTGQR